MKNLIEVACAQPPELPVGRADVARVRKALGYLVGFSGLSYREIERRLLQQGFGLDVSRLLGGRFQLRLHQLLDILSVLEIHPAEFFSLVFKLPAVRSPFLERVQGLLGPGKPQADRQRLRSPEMDLADVRRRLDELERLVKALSSEDVR